MWPKTLRAAREGPGESSILAKSAARCLARGNIFDSTRWKSILTNTHDYKGVYKFLSSSHG
jgi:hypothetical protein